MKNYLYISKYKRKLWINNNKNFVFIKSSFWRSVWTRTFSLKELLQSTHLQSKIFSYFSPHTELPHILHSLQHMCWDMFGYQLHRLESTLLCMLSQSQSKHLVDTSIWTLLLDHRLSGFHSHISDPLLHNQLLLLVSLLDRQLQEKSVEIARIKWINQN